MDACKGDEVKSKLILWIFLGTFYHSFQIETVMETPETTQFSLHNMDLNLLAQNMDYVQGKLHPRWYLINVLPRDLCADCCIAGTINIPTHLLRQKLKKW